MSVGLSTIVALNPTPLSDNGTMKTVFVEREVIERDGRTVLQQDYSHSIAEQMSRDSLGFYHSCGTPISLVADGPKKRRFVKGYDLGRGNVISVDAKVIDCAEFKDEGRGLWYVAYICPSSEANADGSNELRLYVIDDSLGNRQAADDSSKNIFESLPYEIICTEGINGHLSIDKVSDEVYVRWWNIPDSGKTIKACSYNTEIKSLDSHPLEVPETSVTLGWDCSCDCDNVDILATDETGLYVVVVSPKEYVSGKCPVIVVCLGGPFIRIPSFEEGSIYQQFTARGYMVIVPLRRGVIGLSLAWERALDGKFGYADVEDVISGTRYVLQKMHNVVDYDRICLYGASYGGFTALLIAGKHNSDHLFRAIVSHCGMSDLIHYPFECSGIPEFVMDAYAGTQDYSVYSRLMAKISPLSYVADISIPVLLVHTIDDNMVWFGQSVRFYNECIRNDVDAELILANGPHSYDIPDWDALLEYILEFIAGIPFRSQTVLGNRGICSQVPRL